MSRAASIGEGRFPFPRKKGSEKGSWQTLAGVARKPDFFPEVLLEVLFWAVGSGGGRNRTYRKSGSPFEPKGSPSRLLSDPILLFLEDSGVSPIKVNGGP